MTMTELRLCESSASVKYVFITEISFEISENVSGLFSILSVG